MTDTPAHESEDSSEGRQPVDRRSLLRGMAASGVVGSLAGCLGIMQQEYEATPAKVPEDTAEENGLEDPEVEKREGKIKQNMVVGNIESDVTSYTTTYKETDREEQEPQPTPTPTPTPTPSPTPTPAPTPPEPPEDDDEEVETPSQEAQIQLVDAEGERFPLPDKTLINFSSGTDQVELESNDVDLSDFDFSDAPQGVRLSILLSKPAELAPGRLPFVSCSRRCELTGPNGNTITADKDEGFLVYEPGQASEKGTVFVSSVDNPEQYGRGDKFDIESATRKVTLSEGMNQLTLSVGTGSSQFSVDFPNQRIKQAENGQQYVTVNDVFMKQGGFIDVALVSNGGHQNIGVSDYIEPDTVVNANIVLDNVESLKEEQTHKLVAVPRKESNGQPGESYLASFWQDGIAPGQYSFAAWAYFGGIEPVEPNTFSINSTPSPDFVGQSLNPLATQNIEELIQNNPKAFERACGCTIDKPQEAQVKKVGPGVTLSEDDVGKTVFHLKKDAMGSDVPQQTMLLGEQVPIEYFVVTSVEEPGSQETEEVAVEDAMKGGRIQWNVASVTKSEGQLRSGTQEAVIASYVQRSATFLRQGLGTEVYEAATDPDSGVGPGTDLANEGGTKVSDVCPNVTGTTTTQTPTPTPTPTPVATPPSDFIDEYVTLVQEMGQTISQLEGIGGRVASKKSAAETEILKIQSVAELIEAAKIPVVSNWLLMGLDPDSMSQQELSQLKDRLVENGFDGSLDSRRLVNNTKDFVEGVGRMDKLEKNLRQQEEKLLGMWNGSGWAPALKVRPVAPFWDEPTALVNTIPAILSNPLVEIFPEQTPVGTEVAATPTPTPTRTPTPNKMRYSLKCIDAEIRLQVGHGASYNPFGHAWIEIATTWKWTCSGPETTKTSTYTTTWRRGHYGNKTLKPELGKKVVCTPATESITCKKARSIKRGASPFSSGYNVATRNCLDWAAKQFKKANKKKGNRVDSNAGWVSKPCQLCPSWTC
jgi:hypothetical protein